MKNLIKTSLVALVVSVVAFAPVNSAKAVTMSYASTVGSVIDFPGNSTFSFAPAVSNFVITSGAAGGLLGEMNGSFTIGNITTVGGLSTAPVTGSGSFEIDEGGGIMLTADLDWQDIFQLSTQGGLDVGGQVNLTHITYNGGNSALLALAMAGNGENVLSFQFVPSVSLFTLKNGPGDHQTSFSGSITTVPDGGSAVALLGIALAGVEILRRKLRAA